MRFPWSKPKAQASSLTEIPADYNMLLHMLELGSVTIKVERVSRDTTRLRIALVREDTEVQHVETFILNTHAELRLHNVFLYTK